MLRGRGKENTEGFSVLHEETILPELGRIPGEKRGAKMLCPPSPVPRTCPHRTCD